ncbi:M4 family metallopeptidase [Frigoribacterium faeni]|uniref:Neutral metalloproteinase n=1 Tax=Frigoribacterium faeni TaxID=145483 RepID=A0A7W3JI09_9MICO|nr:M4 family metallopeptidase [Frigoribacterium faeni]MBA8813242.1 Zn-dependent metalloprotease [Frigoribacterium faeni]BFF14449.1 M4 family metallopeptidase [Microbacterium flavescens]GEK82893.1 metalloprotease [Frigoribacterium faeni]
MSRFIVPPYLLAHLAEAESPRLHRAPRAARNGLLAMEAVDRNATPPVTRGVLGGGSVLERTVFDAEGTEELPGVRVRGEGEPATDDVAATEAYDALGATYALFDEVYGRSSIDGAGLPLDATVHYGVDYDNAFWNGERMVFGDGDGEVFQRFTASVSVIGHELTHGVTQYTANLTYQGQSGALNESVSDVFGALVEQHLFSQTVEQATWLIGEGLFTPEVQGRALRSMRSPGTAYDDDVLGKDPQPGHMDDYVETDDDNGGVHLNSGIPNRAFFLVAEALGGTAWDRAGRIWYDTLTGGSLSTEATFAQFAAATVLAATARYGADSDEARATSAGWAGVGVIPAP